MIDNSRRTGAAVEAHYQFLTWLMPTIEKFPMSHEFTIGDRVQITALDVLEALIEATYTRDRLQHLRRANLGIEKLRFLLRLAADLKEHSARALDETGTPDRRVDEDDPSTVLAGPGDSARARSLMCRFGDRLVQDAR